MSQELGRQPDEAMFTKDAVYVPIISMLAEETLSPADKIRIHETGCFKCTDDQYNGIVDPFLPKDVQIGEYFWALIRPGLVDKLRHDYILPGIPNTTKDNDYEEYYGCP
jgi:hypothetical protein